MKSLVLFLICLLASALALVAKELEAVPIQFSAEVGDAFGHRYSVKLHDGELLYLDLGNDHSDAKPITISPTRQQWRNFRTSLDGINVWNWLGSYGPPEGTVVVDGSGWSLKIQYSDKKIVSEGNNFYPDGDGKSARNNPTATFIGFEDAIEKLIGGREFRAATYKESTPK